jgi:formylmethanofuran dehydrogenase subunit C
MNCTTLTKIIEAIWILEPSFEKALELSNHKDSLYFAEQIKLAMVEYRNEFPDLAEDFMDQLDKDKLYDAMSAYAEMGTYTVNENISVKYPSAKIRQQDFDRLIPRLKSRYGKIENFDLFCGEAIRLFFSVYEPGDEPIKIRMEQLPAALLKSFGKFWDGGRIEIGYLSTEGFKEARRGSMNFEGTYYTAEWFTEMKNGSVKLDEMYATNDAVSFLGSQMEGGYIGADDIEGHVGANMRGGTIVVKSLSGGSIGNNAHGGTVFVKNFCADKKRPSKKFGGAELFYGSTGGTFIVDNISGEDLIVGGSKEATVLIKVKRSRIANNPGNGQWDDVDGHIIYYDEEKDKFGKVNEPAGRISHLGYERGFVSGFDMQTGIYSLAMRQSDFESDFSFMKGGIILVKAVGACQNLGEKMKDGCLIIDDPNISLEEARSRVAPRSKRPGGVVLYLKKWTEGKVFKKKKAEFVVL